MRFSSLRHVVSPLNFFFYRRALARPPLIIVGMHRSGTTLLGELLEECGVFQGAFLSRSINRESKVFQDINRMVLDNLGCSWRTLDFLPSHQELCDGHDWITHRFERHLKGGLVPQHFGSKRWLLLQKKPVWGWKDPRTSLLLPAYQRLFPQATLVHIYRDGRDVALSLLTRDLKRQGAAPLSPPARETRTIHDLRLWEQYLRRIEAAAPLFPRTYSIRYENLLANPLEEMEKLIESCNLKPSKSLPEIVKSLDPTRAGRVQNGAATWTNGLESQAPLLRELGYV